MNTSVPSFLKPFLEPSAVVPCRFLPAGGAVNGQVVPTPLHTCSPPEGPCPPAPPASNPPAGAPLTPVSRVAEAPEPAAQVEAESPPPQFLRALDELRHMTQSLFQEAKLDAVMVGIQVASRILEREVATDTQALLTLAHSALKRAGERRVIRVRMSPQDAQRVQEHPLKPPAAGAAAGRLEVIADAGLSAGDVVVETDAGTVDGRLSTRLKALETNLASAATGEDEP